MEKISVVLIAALVVSLLFGCGKSDDAKGTGKTTLSVWYWGEQEVPGYKAYMEEMVKRYEKKNPDIKVEAVLQESDNLYTTLQYRGRQRRPGYSIYVGRNSGNGRCLERKRSSD